MWRCQTAAGSLSSWKSCRFIENLSLGILVNDLSLRLDDYPLTYYYNAHGKSVGEGVRSLLTNEQVIRLCLRMIASQRQGSRQVRLVFVGTHRDLEDKCTQSRKEKNRRLKEMVESFGLEDCVIYRNRQFEELIFAVNAKYPEAVDRQTIGDLRELMMDESAANDSSQLPLLGAYSEAEGERVSWPNSVS